MEGPRNVLGYEKTQGFRVEICRSVINNVVCICGLVIYKYTVRMKNYH